MAWRGELVAAMVVAMLGCESFARAANPTPTQVQSARELFGKAEADEDAGRWDAALEKLHRAASVKKTPGLVFHIALCEEKLGQLTAALRDYAAAESQARDEGNREVLDAVADPLAALRPRVPTLTVTVPGGPSDAEVLVDGAPLAIGLWGVAVPVEVGSHVIQAKATGRAPFSATATTAEREAKVVTVILPAAQPADTSARGAAVPATPTAATATTGEPTTAARTPDRHRTPAIVTSIGAVALVGAGVASFLVAGAKQSSARTDCASSASVAACDALKGPVRTFDWLALSAWIGAAAVGTIAVVLWVTPAPVAAGTAPNEHAARLVLTPGSINLTGAF